MILSNLTPTECTSILNIANGASLSGLIDTVDAKLVALKVDGWTAAGISLDGSTDGVAFFPIFGNAAATQLVFVPAADVIINSWLMLGSIAGLAFYDDLPRWLKIRSGTDAAPVNQLALRTINLILHPKHPPIYSGG